MRSHTASPETPGQVQTVVDGLTVERAQALAEQAHPELALAAARIEVAAARVDQASQLPNPRAVARMESAPIDGNTRDEAEYVLGISQTIPLGNRLSAATRASELDRERAMLDCQAKWLEIRARVRGAFATALFSERAFSVQGQAVTLTENASAITKARLAHGEAIPEEVARAEMELVRARLDLATASSLHERAIIELIMAIGLRTLTVTSVRGTLETELELPTLDSLAARLSTHPSFAAAQAEIATKRASVELAEAQRIPDVNLDLFYRRLEGSNRNAFDIGLEIPIPLFDTGQGRLREAQAEFAGARARAAATQNDLYLTMRDAHAKLTGALAAAKLLREEIVPRSEIILRATESRYAAGDIGLVEALPVRRDHLSVQLSYLEAMRAVMQAWTCLLPFLEGTQ